MSNKNKNRNRPQVEQKLPEDKPFVFHSKTGSVIRIPRDVVFDPDADAALAIAEAEESGNGLQASAALLRMLRSGFPQDIADTLNLKLSELEQFSREYFAFTGVEFPK